MYNLLMIKRLKRLLFENLFVFLIAFFILFVLLVSLVKILFAKPKYVYTKVKVSQGLWWANTTRPQLWMLKPLTKGLKSNDLLGKPTAEVLSVNYYPWTQEPAGQYNAFMYMRLKVTGNKKTGYQYDRGILSIGSPVTFEFPKLSISGTVIDLSDSPIEDSYEEKIILIEKAGLLDWEYNEIKVGGKYFDGTNTVFVILEKSATDEYINVPNYEPTNAGVMGSQSYQTRKRVHIKAKIKVKMINEYYVFGEEQIISIDKDFYLYMPSVAINNYKIIKIE